LRARRHESAALRGRLLAVLGRADTDVTHQS
jgi:hypothetical protein